MPGDAAGPRPTGARKREERRRRHPMVRLAGTVARLPRYLNLAQALVRDPALSPRRKAALTLGIGYALSPVDLIPGIIPVAGQLDDLAALLVALRHALAGCSPEAAQAHLARVGLSETALDADLRTVAVAGVWLVARAASLGARVLRAPLRLLAGTVDIRRAPAEPPPAPAQPPADPPARSRRARRAAGEGTVA